MLIVGKKLISDMKESTLNKIKKYYDEHPFFENYRGWVIRIHSYKAKYLGTLTHYTCDVQPGLESCQATHIEMVREWIDKKISEGKTQKEDIWRIK